MESYGSAQKSKMHIASVQHIAIASMNMHLLILARVLFPPRYTHPSAEGFETGQLLGHLTNASIHKNTSAYEEDKDVIGKGSKWDFKQWQQWFKDQNRPLAYHVVWERIKTVIQLTTLPLLSVLPPSPVPFEVSTCVCATPKALNFCSGPRFPALGGWSHPVHEPRRCLALT